MHLLVYSTPGGSDKWRGRGAGVARACLPLGYWGGGHKQTNKQTNKQTTQLKLKQGPYTECCFSQGECCIPGTRARSEALILGPLILGPLILGPLVPVPSVRRGAGVARAWRGLCLSPQGSGKCLAAASRLPRDCLATVSRLSCDHPTTSGPSRGPFYRPSTGAWSLFVFVFVLLFQAWKLYFWPPVEGLQKSLYCGIISRLSRDCLVATVSRLSRDWSDSPWTRPRWRTRTRAAASRPGRL